MSFQHAQIGAGPLVVTNRTMEFVDFTHPFLSLRSSALLRKHPPPVTHHRFPSSSSSASTPSPNRHPPNSHHLHQQHQQHDVITDSIQLLQSNLTYGVIYNSVAYHMLAYSREHVTRAMWSRMTTLWPRAFVHSVQEGIERARQGGYAFIIDTPTAEYAAGQQPCDLYTTDPFLDVMSYAFVMRKADSGLRHVIDRELRKMKWSDEMQTMFLRWWRNECVPKSSSHLPLQRSKELPTKEKDVAAAGDSYMYAQMSNSALRTPPIVLLCSCIFISTAAYLFPSLLVLAQI